MLFDVMYNTGLIKKTYYRRYHNRNKIVVVVCDAWFLGELDRHHLLVTPPP